MINNHQLYERRNIQVLATDTSTLFELSLKTEFTAAISLRFNFAHGHQLGSKELWCVFDLFILMGDHSVYVLLPQNRIFIESIYSSVACVF